MAFALVAVFLLLIYGVPLAQVGLEAARAERSMLLDLSKRKPTRAALQRYEEDLEKASYVRRWVRPRVQHLITRFGGFGNSKAVVGRDGWLFYGPDVEHVFAGGFLDAERLSRQAAPAVADANEPPRPSRRPDPRPAILDFARQLTARGVSLLVVPVPTKAEIYPDRISSALGPEDAPLQNASFPPFKAALEAAGVLVLDVAPELAAARHVWTRPVYLSTDTHMTPEAVQLVARRIAEIASTRVPWTTPQTSAWRRQLRRVSNLGDIAVMLDLAAPDVLFPREAVKIQRIIGSDGRAVTSSPEAEVLVLGDSFANIYSLAALGWGEGAGLVEQLGFALGRPVDALLRNDQGAFATREMLARELQQGRDRLAHKKLVVWVFAARELSLGDWRFIDLPAPSRQAPPATVSAGGARFLTLARGESRQVRGRVASVAPVPRPGSVPYRDHIVAVHLVDVRSVQAAASLAAARREAVVYMWGMRDNTWTEAAGLRAGQELALTLRPWDDVAPDLERINRSELSDTALALEPAAWGEPAQAKDQTL